VVDLVRRQKDEKPVLAADASRGKEIVIAVDAGHGGEDPGAIGHRGLMEKQVTLAVARELARVINARPGMRAVMVRKGDYFVPLGQRVKIARKAKADLMISIHADSARSRRASGASVYTLSERGASDKVAAMLAEKENASDAIGGTMPEEVEDPLVNRILVDLIKRDSLNSAQLLARDILRQLDGVGPIKYEMPKHARFVVLGATEIPSVLVELDYISNPRQERLLRKSGHQKKMAKALMRASESFLRKQGRLKAKGISRVHVVKSGESLWSIARRYGVSISSLRSANGLKRQASIRIGQRLVLPSS
jgi:N-acetylmuramoyl-L-alanine amidase